MNPCFDLKMLSMN